MNAHDVYVVSPYLAMAGAATLVIIFDLVLGRRIHGLLPYLAFLMLAGPFVLSLVQFYDLGLSANLVRNGDGGNEASILLGSLSVDRFALFFNFLITGAVALVVLASTDYVRLLPRFQGEYFGLLLFSATGMMLLAAATELITIYVALELTTLPLAALGAFLMNGRSSEAGIKFLIIGAISSALLLYGMALVFGFTGSTQLAEISAAVAQAGGGVAFGNYALLVGLVLLVAGFGFKISAAPFQMWVPDVYEGAPTPVVAFLSVASKAAGFAVLLRVMFTGFFDVSLDWGVLLAALAAASMTIGNLVAITQSNIRRLFGYSTIAHAGYLLVGVAAGVQAAKSGLEAPVFAAIGPDSVLFYLGAYTAANLTAFFAIAAISERVGSDRISDYSGLITRSPGARHHPGAGADCADRCASDRDIHREAVCVHRRRRQRAGVAGHRGRGEQRGIGLLLRANHTGDVPAAGSGDARFEAEPEPHAVGGDGCGRCGAGVHGGRARVRDGGGGRRGAGAGSVIAHGPWDTSKACYYRAATDGSIDVPKRTESVGRPGTHPGG